MKRKRLLISGLAAVLLCAQPLVAMAKTADNSGQITAYTQDSMGQTGGPGGMQGGMGQTGGPGGMQGGMGQTGGPGGMQGGMGQNGGPGGMQGGMGQNGAPGGMQGGMGQNGAPDGMQIQQGDFSGAPVKPDDAPELPEGEEPQLTDELPEDMPELPDGEMSRFDGDNRMMPPDGQGSPYKPDDAPELPEGEEPQLTDELPEDMPELPDGDVTVPDDENRPDFSDTTTVSGQTALGEKNTNTGFFSGIMNSIRSSRFGQMISGWFNR